MVSYSDPQSPFYVPESKEDPEITDLVRQFQDAAQRMSEHEKHDVEQIKLEILRMRNLPDLNTILEANGESGTHTFSRDLSDLLNK